MSTGGLRYQYARLNIAEKLIVINVAVFILNALLPFLLGLGKNAISQWFELPVDLMAFLFQPWSIVSYSFFHADFFHLFWNMLLLYFSARIFLNLFSARTLVNVYFLGVILGGLLFVLSYNVFPVFLGSNSAIIGASAGVTAVLIFICAYIPNQEVRVLFFNIKLWYIGAFFVLVDLISIPASNSGGHLAHLGGALLGYVYARQLAKGKDIGEGFSKLLDGLGAMFKPREKKAPMKTVYRKKSKVSSSKIDYDKESRQRKIDNILDKISKSGYESLSKAEKDFLFKAGKEE
ncbi:Membrane associated serine protease, rhomboid family [Muriicola jejuensis]|uniref:Rhomboid family intramembrane serine protease n=1 Tax=Muriicola jejuensis TaxID=504488 RepID=A0A6P0UKS0_9FLAO|nr:rhomboid family intramembrane serine protease [Muriicola jejuensis]NER10826.1 rhomboid family intramembrane serine protease [Muriicola jejuensis]SMP16183.1 Membrane associated serine protease, rhomboid family [Muriicola jejuensis]